MTRHRNPLASGIVRRLRVVFLSISLVLVSAMIIGLQQLMSLERSTQQLTEFAVPVFDGAEELERNLKNLLLLLQKVDTLTDQAAFDTLRTAVRSQLAVLRSEMHNYARVDRSGIVTRDMQNALAQIERDTNVTLAATGAALINKAALDNMSAQLTSTRSQAHHALEQLSFTSLTHSLPSGTRASSSSPADAGIPAIPSPGGLGMASTLTELTLKFETIMDRAMALHKQGSPAELSEAGRSLSFNIREVTVLLGRLPDTPERAALAHTVMQIRDLAYNEAGLIRTTETLMAEMAALESAKARQIAPIELISTRSTQLTHTGRAEVKSASNGLTMALDRLVFVLVFSAVIVLLVILVAVIFIVELQINHRMARLTRSVLAIADGQNETEVDVHGPDELGKIARALDVFKLNAHELQRSNTELEKFAYVAAHDLRSPLRAIQDLTDWTLEDPDTSLSEDSQQNMELLQRRILRLNQLLSDLLEYSRVGKDASEVAPVCIETLVSDTAELLDPEDNFSIRYHGPHEPVSTLATPLRHILLNLISNAIKHHDRDHGEITVNAQLDDTMLTCTIHDDGPGIEPQYHDRIFALFQTLRPRDEVEGSGLGLAIIRKLLEHHGGHIEVRSDPQKARGTAFVFTLPGFDHLAAPLDQAA